MGSNSKNQSGISRNFNEIYPEPTVVFNLKHFKQDKNERILEIKCSNGHNIIRTSHQLIFLGGNEHRQFPNTVGNYYEL